MGKCEKWTVAYRKRTGAETILDDLNTPFCSVPNTWRYWRADPFLFEKDGRTFLFAELYDRLALRGVLGCCELTEQGAGTWTIVLNEPFHLSYPHVFEENGTVYMIPESLRAGEIILYRAVEFPYRWERVKRISDCGAVDSTRVVQEGKQYLITVRVEHQVGELAVLSLDDDWNAKEIQTASGKNADNVRGGGNVFQYRGKLVRPTQDSSRGYGYALNFAEITRLDESHLEEEIFCKIRPDDVKLDRTDVPEGIHTYNFSDRYEVIDYKEYEFGFVCKLAKIWKMVFPKRKKQ